MCSIEKDKRQTKYKHTKRVEDNLTSPTQTAPKTGLFKAQAALLMTYDEKGRRGLQREITLKDESSTHAKQLSHSTSANVEELRQKSATGYKSKKNIAADEAAFVERLRRDIFGAFHSSSMPSKIRVHAENTTTEQENLSVGDPFKSNNIAADETAFIERLRRDTFGAFHSSSIPSNIRVHAEKNTTEQDDKINKDGGPSKSEPTLIETNVEQKVHGSSSKKDTTRNVGLSHLMRLFSGVGSWECSRCSYINECSNNTCDVCEGPKDEVSINQ